MFLPAPDPVQGRGLGLRWVCEEEALGAEEVCSLQHCWEGSSIGGIIRWWGRQARPRTPRRVCRKEGGEETHPLFPCPQEKQTNRKQP